MQKQIQLAEYRTYPGAKVFSGRPRGEEVRRLLKFDDCDRAPDCSAIIQIPDDTYAFNMSFFLGLCSESVKKIGAEEFSKKYQFSGPEILLSDLPEFIDQALKESTPLKREK